MRSVWSTVIILGAALPVLSATAGAQLSTLIKLRGGWNSQAVEKLLGPPSSKEGEQWEYSGPDSASLVFKNGELSNAVIELDHPVDPKRVLPSKTRGTVQEAHPSSDVVDSAQIFEVAERGMRLQIVRGKVRVIWISKPWGVANGHSKPLTLDQAVALSLKPSSSVKVR